MLSFARVSQKVVGEVHVFSVYINTCVRSSIPVTASRTIGSGDLLGFLTASGTLAMKLASIFLLVTIGFCGYSGKPPSGASRVLYLSTSLCDSTAKPGTPTVEYEKRCF